MSELHNQREELQRCAETATPPPPPETPTQRPALIDGEPAIGRPNPPRPSEATPRDATIEGGPAIEPPVQAPRHGDRTDSIESPTAAKDVFKPVGAQSAAAEHHLLRTEIPADVNEVPASTQIQVVDGAPTIGPPYMPGHGSVDASLPQGTRNATDDRLPVPHDNHHDLPQQRDDVEQPPSPAPQDKPVAADPVGDVDIICDHDPSVAEPVDADLEQRFADYRQHLTDEGRTRPAHEPGPAYDYQREWCGHTEFRVSPDANLPKAAWADGLNDQLALAQDAKYIKVDSRSTWFIPDTLPPAMAGLAERKMDERLIKYRDAIESPDNPIRGLEIIVNRLEAAQFMAERMNALGIPGIVRIRQ